jgi:hypothetical protein
VREAGSLDRSCVHTRSYRKNRNYQVSMSGRAFQAEDMAQTTKWGEKANGFVWLEYMSIEVRGQKK